MHKNEYWFLNAVVRDALPLRILESENLEVIINGNGHGLGHSALISVLQHLFQSGLLSAMETHRAGFTPTSSDIEAGLKGVRNIYFYLTAQGGALWESLSQPNWDRFIEGSTCFEPEEVEVICPSKHLAEEYFSLAPFPVVPIAGGETWDIVCPWEATYWKTLPAAHRIKCPYRDESPPHMNRAQMEQLCRLYTWYVHPFEDRERGSEGTC
jgi:hypothetical protein